MIRENATLTHSLPNDLAIQSPFAALRLPASYGHPPDFAGHTAREVPLLQSNFQGDGNPTISATNPPLRLSPALRSANY